MATEEKTSNTFSDMEKEKANKPADNAATTKPNDTSGELSLDDFSNTAVGDKVKYNRPDLNGKEDVVDKFQVFMPNINEEEPKLSQDQKTKYWPVTILITYASENEDGMQNREYLSGAKVFQQQNGSPSDISFFYEGADNQVSNLWEKVAEAKGVGSLELSPREFIAFLNNRPKIKIEGKKFKNFGATNGPSHITKNMVGSFL